MARNNYNNFSGYQFSPRSPFMGDPLRNPYESEFRTPHGPPPTGFSPRQQFSSNRLKRPFPQNSVSPNRLPYGGNSSFQHSASTPYNANLSFQSSPNFSPYNSSFQQSPNTTSSPSNYSRNSSGCANQSFSSPKNTYQRQNHHTGRDSNPGGSINVRDYYRPSIVDDPWKNLKPSRIAPMETRSH